MRAHGLKSTTLEAAVALPGGTFDMGSEELLSYPADGEGPVRSVTIDGFSINPYTVTNAEFCRFVEVTGYETDAERYGWSFVFAGLLPDHFAPTRGVVDAPWWRQVGRAAWDHPEGPHSDIASRMDHPVVHISWNDADAYCTWVEARLPTEAEWEFAARGGLSGKPFPWGDELEPNGVHRMNVWQGVFPQSNTCADGWYGTCPVDSYEPNAFGLFNMTGNVWEWCSDWFHPTFHAAATRINPSGPVRGTRRVTRGGSYLCHESYCGRYRVSARNALTPDSSNGNTGFRCVGA